MLEVKHLTKKYGEIAAVSDLNFSIEDKRIYGFLGPNGAGKSTTMNIITGYLAPTEGEITIDGIDILKKAEKAKAKIGYLPEIPPLYPDMTVSEYLNFAAELKKTEKSDRREKLDSIMEKTHTKEVEKRLIRNLSKGYRQRVGLAQALIGDPPLIILDEPTVGLDPLQIIEIRQLIKELGQEHTVILSSHILQEISAVCDHIMVISHGRLVASDTPDNLAKSVTGEVSTFLKVRGSAIEAKEKLEAVQGVEEVNITSSDEDGVINIELKAKEDSDIREAVFRTMAGADMPILDMRTARPTLEDVYLKLTEDSPEAIEEKTEETETVNEETSEKQEGDVAETAASETEKSVENAKEADNVEVVETSENPEDKAAEEEEK